MGRTLQSLLWLFIFSAVSTNWLIPPAHSAAILPDELPTGGQKPVIILEKSGGDPGIDALGTLVPSTRRPNKSNNDNLTETSPTATVDSWDFDAIEHYTRTKRDITVDGPTSTVTVGGGGSGGGLTEDQKIALGVGIPSTIFAFIGAFAVFRCCKKRRGKKNQKSSTLSSSSTKTAAQGSSDPLSSSGTAQTASSYTATGSPPGAYQVRPMPPVAEMPETTYVGRRPELSGYVLPRELAA